MTRTLPTCTLHRGHALEVLRTLPAGSAQLCATSPPYYQLRNYGGAAVRWPDGTISSLGQEPEPELYVQHLTAVMAEVRRVLRPDGICFLNLADSYEDKELLAVPWLTALSLRRDGWKLRQDIIWAKGMSFSDAYVGTTMPESVTDRCTRAHEYIFLLTKQADYYWDAQAIAEPATDALLAQVEQGYDGAARKDYVGAGVQDPSALKARIIGNARKRADRFGGNKHTGETTKHSDGSVYTGLFTRNTRSVWAIRPHGFDGEFCTACRTFFDGEDKARIRVTRRAGLPPIRTCECGRSDAWLSHFATWPEALIDPMLRVGARAGDMVLDPFTGSGTTALVALRTGRSFVGVDLNADYLDMAAQRIRADAPLFNAVETVDHGAVDQQTGGGEGHARWEGTEEAASEGHQDREGEAGAGAGRRGHRDEGGAWAQGEEVAEVPAPAVGAGLPPQEGQMATCEG